MRSQPFFISHFCRSEVKAQHDLAGSLLSDSQNQNQGVSRAVFLSQGSRDESASKLLQLIGNTQFHVVVELRSPFSCQLLSPSRCHLHPLAHGPLLPSLKPATEAQLLLMHLSREKLSYSPGTLWPANTTDNCFHLPHSDLSA